MSGLLRSALASVLLFLFLPATSIAQCAVGDEVCLQTTESSQRDESQNLDSADEVTTETFTDEQADLVAQITRNLKRRRLTRPIGDNALEQIQRLQVIHPLHDYSVNGSRYIARIMMVLGRRALRNGDPKLADYRLQQALKFDPSVSRQAELAQGIARLNNNSAVPAPQPESSLEAEQPVLDSGQPSQEKAPEDQRRVPQQDEQRQQQAEPLPDDPAHLALENAPFKGVVTTETFTQEQAELVAGITSDLKLRRLHEPVGSNAVDKIQRLRELHPAHDYSVNGIKYVARILMVLGRQSLRKGDLELASRHMLKAIQFDPQVGRQDELKTAIASAARDAAKDARDAARDRESERNTKAFSEQTTSLTSYLESDSTKSRQTVPPVDIDFVAPVMVALPAGSFLMGSEDGEADERPVHNVVVEAFSMSKHEVTVEQYQVFALATGRLAPQYLPQERNLPVTNVSWHDAIAYADWLSIKTQKLFRLPTESEWEYAARAGTTTKYFTGDTLVNAANCAGCGGQWAGKSVAPVGSFDPNEFGLYDMHGNVWEWVQDCWTPNYNHRTESAVAVELNECQHRVLRGGSWYHDASRASVSYRGNEKTHHRDSGVGFRVVYEGL